MRKWYQASQIHNRLAGGAAGPLTRFKWSSLPSYIKGSGPDWLVTERVLRSFELAQDGRGRRAYVAWLEAAELPWTRKKPNLPVTSQALASMPVRLISDFVVSREEFAYI